MSAQLTLPIEMGETYTLDNFISALNVALIEYLKKVLSDRRNNEEASYAGIVIWGEVSAGKTHLLAALSDYYTKQLGGKVYLINQASVHRLQIRKGDPTTLYIMEDIDTCMERMEDQKNVLSVIEKIKQQNSTLLITSKKTIKKLNISLADLSSRLQSLESFELLPLDDSDKRIVLKDKATERGFSLSDDVLNWLLTHSSRDLGVLVTLLDKIDEASLAQHRKVTIPLIKSLESS